jgi:hypothetical protein
MAITCLPPARNSRNASATSSSLAIPPHQSIQIQHDHLDAIVILHDGWHHHIAQAY